MRVIATPLKRIFPAAIFLSVALASLVTAWVAYVGVAGCRAPQVRGDCRRRAQPDREQHRPQSVAADGDAGVLHDARRRRFRRSKFNQYYNALNADANFPGLRGIGFLRLMRTGDEAEVERDILKPQGIARRIFPETDQPWRTPLMMFEPSIPAISTPSATTCSPTRDGARRWKRRSSRTSAGDRPSHARPGDRERADLSGLSRFFQDRDHAGGRNGRHAESGDRRLPLCRVSRRRPVQHGARQVAVAAGQCRGLRHRRRSGQSSVQVGGTAGQLHSATHWR